MKLFVFFLLSSLVIETIHADQRLGDIRLGILCDKIQETEKRMGSVELAVHDEEGISRYTGSHGGKNATLVYRCVKGRLVEQIIIVTTTSRDEGLWFANEQIVKLIEQFGDPVHNGLELGIWKRLYFGFMGADLDYLTSVVVWGRAKEDALLSIMKIGTSQWEVTISRGGSKNEYIFNS